MSGHALFISPPPLREIFQEISKNVKNFQKFFEIVKFENNELLPFLPLFPKSLKRFSKGSVNFFKKWQKTSVNFT